MQSAEVIADTKFKIIKSMNYIIKNCKDDNVIQKWLDVLPDEMKKISQEDERWRELAIDNYKYLYKDFPKILMETLKSKQVSKKGNPIFSDLDDFFYFEEKNYHEFIYSMNNIIRYLNDEDEIESWLALCVPDGVESLQEIKEVYYEMDEEEFKQHWVVFLNTIKYGCLENGIFNYNKWIFIIGDEN